LVGTVEPDVFEAGPDPAIPQGIEGARRNDLPFDVELLRHVVIHVPAGIDHLVHDLKGSSWSLPGRQANADRVDLHFAIAWKMVEPELREVDEDRFIVEGLRKDHPGGDDEPFPGTDLIGVLDTVGPGEGWIATVVLQRDLVEKLTPFNLVEGRRAMKRVLLLGVTVLRRKDEGRKNDEDTHSWESPHHDSFLPDKKGSMRLSGTGPFPSR